MVADPARASALGMWSGDSFSNTERLSCGKFPRSATMGPVPWGDAVCLVMSISGLRTEFYDLLILS